MLVTILTVFAVFAVIITLLGIAAEIRELAHIGSGTLLLILIIVFFMEISKKMEKVLEEAENKALKDTIGWQEYKKRSCAKNCK
jgi:hypothetical protein